MQNKGNKALFVVAWILVGLFAVGLFAGRAIGIIATDDDVAGFGDFWSRLVIWDSFYAVVFLALIIGTGAAFRRHESK